MATYLQGVTDYIPDYQPFQPDLNFYANVLQTKQTQYDTNWKSLNNLYGELHNANLTHDLNIKKKDDLLKQIDFNIKRVSGLDLSLQQNVDQATQVFRPFYEDKYLMKDMAWTKNYTSTLSRALNLRNSQDEKMRNQYWDTGIKDMQYRREEFKNASLDETLNMGNVTYTPYVNAMEKYLKLAKETGLSIDVKDVDSSGLYFVREKNGKALMSPLQNLFMSAYANDPALQAVYATQSYVKRKDYAEQHADKFNGDKVEAEKQYLKEQYDYLKNYTSKKSKEAKETVDVTKNKMNNVQQQKENNNAGPHTDSYLESLDKAFAIDETVANHADKLDKEINDNHSSTITTTGTVGNPDMLDLSNLELARLKVDAGTASVLAEQDILGAADIYAYKDYVYEKSANPVGLENLRQQNALARIDYTHQLKKKEMELKFQYDTERDRIKQGLEDGTMWYDKNGELQIDDGSSHAITLGSPSGQFSDEYNTLAKNNKEYNETISNMTGTYIGNTLLRLKQLTDAGEISSKEAWDAVSWLDPNSKDAKERYNTKDGRKLVNQLWNKYQNNNDKFILDFTKSNQVIKLKKFMDRWANANTGHTIADEYHADRSALNIQKFVIYRDEAKIVDKANHDKISKNLITAMDNAGYGKLKDETKQRIADLFIKKIKSGAQLDEDDFEDFVNKNLSYEQKGYATGNTAVDKRLAPLLGKEKTREYGEYMEKQKRKWSEMQKNKDFWKSSEGQKLTAQGISASNFEEYLDKQSNKFLAENISDEAFKKYLAKDVYEYNKSVDERRKAFEKRSPAGDRYDKGEFNLKKKKSPYEYTKEELAQAKRAYLKNLDKQNVGHAQLNESLPKGRISFEEKTGFDIDDIYSTLSESYLKTTNQTGPDGLLSYHGVVRTKDGRYSLGANDVTAKDVRLNRPGWGGFKDFQEGMADINRIRFAQDPSKFAVSYGGLTKTAVKDFALDPAETKAMLRELQMSAGKKSKTAPFKIARSPIAMENPNLKAFIVIPSQAFLEKHIKTDEGKTDWAKIKMIKANGISFIAPKEQWTNSFIHENELTPTEQLINAKGSFEYQHGSGAGSYKIEKVKNVPGVDYSITYNYNWIEEDGTVSKKTDYVPFQKTGNKIDDSQEELFSRIQDVNTHNSEMFRRFQQNGDQDAMARVQRDYKKPSWSGFK
jgi:hypothetical protein